MDWVLDKVVDQSDCGASVGNTKITDLVFADDAVIFAESLEVLVMALEALHEEAKPLGLEVSWLKTKVQMNTTLSRIVAWGNKWQVKLDPHKTQLLNVSRSSAALRLICIGKTLVPQDEVEVLGVTYDNRLTFRAHIERLAREASGKLASLRRMSWLLDSKGLEVLYKAQVVRSSMECAYLGRRGQQAPRSL
ncbi:hypothetical protein GWK47_014584 [Chionoecetes opilio]|uniref:Reverse transcriptase domain-containing protein n=1 Tax=Chionoecetes opilio TaxID=41210 RepID=A0A8J5CNC1_CHIOP|nr:hypothetical protein GWK47_014584 [Chionoecetes opilio]